MFRPFQKTSIIEPFVDGPKCLFSKALAEWKKSGAKFKFPINAYYWFLGSVCEYLSRHVEYIWIEDFFFWKPKYTLFTKRKTTYREQWPGTDKTDIYGSFWFVYAQNHLFGLVPRQKSMFYPFFQVNDTINNPHLKTKCWSN